MIPKCTSWKQQTLSHCFCELEIWEQPSWVVIVQRVSWDCSQDVGHDCSHLKADWAGRSDIPRWHPYTVQLAEASVPCWLLERGCGFSLHGILHGDTWLSPRHGSLLPPEWMIQEQVIQCLLRPSLRTYKQSLLPKLFVRHELLSPVYTQGEWN